MIPGSRSSAAPKSPTDSPAQRGPAFDRDVGPDGYSWWYLDALSDDGRLGVTVIGFIGSVFSPRYRYHRRRGGADPMDHCAVNVALYRERSAWWALTEWPRSRVERSPAALSIGSSRWAWDATGLTVHVDERTTPWRRAVRGTIRLRPDRAGAVDPIRLDQDGRHFWWPAAPHGEVEVAFDQPRFTFVGHGYLDANYGSRALEEDFDRWFWCRQEDANGTTVFYDVVLSDGKSIERSFRFLTDGTRGSVRPTRPHDLRPGFWRMPRPTRAESTTPPEVRRTLEDSPFYLRSVLQSDDRLTVHESLSLRRFVRPTTQFLLPFRIWRRW